MVDVQKSCLAWPSTACMSFPLKTHKSRRRCFAQATYGHSSHGTDLKDAGLVFHLINP